MQVTTYMHFFPVIIAEHLNVRHIIVWAWRALMWPYTEVVLVCMYVHNRFTTEVYKFTYSLRTLRHVPLLVCLSSRYDGRLRGEMTTPGQRIPENASNGTEDV